MWAFAALASAACFAMVTVVEKRLLDRHLRSVNALFLWGFLSTTLYIVITLFLTGIPKDAPADLLFLTFISGVSLGIGLVFFFFALKVEEPSRAVAIVHVYPVYVAILAVTLLDESLRGLHWMAIGLLVWGVMQLSLAGGHGRIVIRPSRATFYLLLAGLGQAIAYFTAKYVLEELSIWTVFLFQSMGLLLVMGLLSGPRAWRDLFGVLKNRNTLVLLLLGETLVPLGAIILGLLALSLAPISVVAPFLAIRPAFVFIAATVLSGSRWKFLDESIAPGSLALKFTAIVMIVFGVAVLGMF